MDMITAIDGGFLRINKASPPFGRDAVAIHI